MEDVDRDALFPNVEIPESFIYESEQLILGLSFALAKSVRSDKTLHDVDLMAALSSLARSYQTLANSGLVYDASLPDVRQQTIVAELKSMIGQYREAEQQNLGASRLRDEDLLRTLVFMLRMAHVRTSGRPLSRAFCDFVIEQFPEQETGLISTGSQASRIIQP